MPNTSKVDKQQPKKSKEGVATPFIPEKKGKKSKIPQEEAQRAEEISSAKKKEDISPEKKEKRKKVAEHEGSALQSSGRPKENSRPAKQSKKPDETIQGPPNATSGSVKRKSAVEASKNASGPLRLSKPVDVHETDVPNQKKRSRDEGEAVASRTTRAKRPKLDGGAVTASSKAKEPSTKGKKHPSKEEVVIMLEDSSDAEVEGDDLIHGFSTDAESSDDDDVMVDEVPPLDVSQLPTVAKDDSTVQKRLQKAKSKPVSTLNFGDYVA
jgi:nucleolar protein 15